MKEMKIKLTDNLYNRINAEHEIELSWWKSKTLEEYIAGCLQVYFDDIDEARAVDEDTSK